MTRVDHWCWSLTLVFASGMCAQHPPQPAAEPEDAVECPATDAARGENAVPEKPERYGLPVLGPSRPTHPSAGPLTLSEKFRYYLAAYEPHDFARSAFWAAIAQWRDSTPEWGQGMEGYGRRFGSRLATHTIRRSLQFGIGAIRREDPRYIGSDKTGKWDRTKYVLSRTFLVRNDNGEDTVAAGRLIGAFGAGLITNAWKPSSSNSIADGFQRGGMTIGGDVIMHMLQEFWPEIRNGLFKRNRERYVPTGSGVNTPAGVQPR